MMKQRRRKCRNCGRLFRPDPRNARHQRYCAKAPCRRASKAASQQRWLEKPENRDYFRGPEQVARVPASELREGRRRVVDWLRKQLIGPVSDQGTLRGLSPWARYPTGVLFPIIRGEDGVDPAFVGNEDDDDYAGIGDEKEHTREAETAAKPAGNFSLPIYVRLSISPGSHPLLIRQSYSWPGNPG